MIRLLRRKASVLALLRCSRLGSNLAVASRTAVLMAGSTRLFPFKTLETVAMLTLAASAICLSPTLLPLGGDFFIWHPVKESRETFRDSFLTSTIPRNRLNRNRCQPGCTDPYKFDHMNSSTFSNLTVVGPLQARGL